MINTKEYLEILNRIPTHIMLVPGVHRWQDGDEWWSDYDEWQTFVPGGYPDSVIEIDEDMQVFRRSIPQHIRENAAWWALYNKLATIPQLQFGYLWVFHKPWHPVGEWSWVLELSDKQGFSYGLRKFETKEKASIAREILGGEEAIIKLLSDGDLMSSWMGEQV